MTCAYCKRNVPTVIKDGVPICRDCARMKGVSLLWWDSEYNKKF